MHMHTYKYNVFVELENIPKVNTEIIKTNSITLDYMLPPSDVCTDFVTFELEGNAERDNKIHVI